MTRDLGYLWKRTKVRMLGYVILKSMLCGSKKGESTSLAGKVKRNKKTSKNKTSAVKKERGILGRPLVMKGRTLGRFLVSEGRALGRLVVTGIMTSGRL